MSEPTHSVVIAAYNAAGTVGQAIRSVLAQTVDDFEIVVVDDGSTDATEELLSGLAAGDGRVRVTRQENAGPSAARNAALERARGAYLTILDSDDVLAPGYLEAVGRTLEADPGAGLVYTRAWVLDEAEGGRIRRETYPASWQVRYRGKPPADPEETLLALAAENFVGAVQTVRGSAVEKSGGYDESLHQAEDYDLWLRIAIAGYRFVETDEVLALVRSRSGSLSKHTVDLNRGARVVCERLLLEYDVPDAVRAVARAQIAQRDRTIATMTGADRRRAAVLRVRLVLGRVYRRLFASRYWYREPPAEVASTFAEAQPRTRT